MAHRSRARLKSTDGSNAGGLISGKPRWMWVEDACRAMIAATTAEGRWQIVREGFVKFEHWARAAFPNLSPFTFTSYELRAMFEGVQTYAATKDKRLHRAFERMYENRHRWDKTKPIESEPTLSDEIAVESIRDGSLRRVH